MIASAYRRLTGTRRGRLLLTAATVLVAVGVLTVSIAPSTNSAYSAKITNSTNQVSTRTYFTCAGAAKGDGATITYAMGDTKASSGTTTMADSSGNGLNGEYTTSGVSYLQPLGCVRDTTKTVTFDGSSGYAYGPNTTYNPTTFSLELWFKATAAGGKLIGFGSSRTGSSGSYDRHIFLNDAGNVVFGVYPGSTKMITSAKTYADSTWHHVVATQGAAGTTYPGIRLYIDGALVASDTNITTNQQFDGYLRIGYDNLTGWAPNTPSNNKYYFTGSMAYVSYYNTVALSPTQVLNHYQAGVA